MGLKSILNFKVPKHLIPRKWSDKSTTGAIRVPSTRSSYQGVIANPFSDWSKTYYQYKVKEGKSFRARRRDKDKWAQRQIALYRQHTEVDGVNPVIFLT